MGKHGKRYWCEVGPKLLAAGLYTDLDHTAFRLLCDDVHIYLDALPFIKNAVDLTEETDAGFRKNPYLTIRDQAHDRLKELLKEFGMTPRSVESVAANQKPDDDPLADLMNLNAAN
jgi:P27 family predicted phage terminase small subunit